MEAGTVRQAIDDILAKHPLKTISLHTGVPAPTLSRIRSGVRNPGLEIVEALLEYGGYGIIKTRDQRTRIMAHFPNPIDPSNVITNATKLRRIHDTFDRVPSDAPIGGITLARGRSPRHLIYVGPCPKDLDKRIRGIVGPRVSIVRDPDQFEIYETITG